jgi:hypothetical protein
MLTAGLGVSPAALRCTGVRLYSAAKKSGLPAPAPKSGVVIDNKCMAIMPD